MNEMMFSIGSDHAGFELKETLKVYMESKGYGFVDLGTFSQQSADYPQYAHAVADSVELGNSDLGILICGSANGVAITANKHQGIRCAICWSVEIAELARAHNNANILALPARFLTVQEAKDILESFVNTEFEGGRHARRVDQISCS